MALIIITFTAQKSQQVERPWDNSRLDPYAPERSKSCGNTTTEAEALGCKYDALSACWLHQDCPRDYEEDFINFRNGTRWRYWYDKEGTQEIASTYDLSHNGHYWTTSREHPVHCSFMLRRGHDVLARGGRPDYLTAQADHADHCAKYLLEFLGVPDEELDQILTYGKIGLLPC